MTFNFKTELKSGALQFAVFVSALIALLIAGLILYAYTFVYMKEQSRAAIENVLLANNGIKYFLSGKHETADTIALDLGRLDGQTVRVHLSQWGIFQKAFSDARHRQKRFSKIALIGSEHLSKESPTLYLQESNNPLSVVGSARIQGNAFIPSQGVRPGYISGESYYGTQLVYGTIMRSGNNLPKLNKDLRLELDAYLDESTKSGFDIYTNDAYPRLSNSFLMPTKNFYSRDAIILKNLEYKGNIVIRSDTLVRIAKTAVLRDVIVCAPTVIVEDGVKGVFQIIATKRITVGQDCIFAYPSALIMVHDGVLLDPAQSSTAESKLTISSGSVLNGVVCFLSDNVMANFEKDIVLEMNASVRGQIYCEGNLQLKGSVSGAVFTRQFLAIEAGAIYVNHIYNGKIENINIPETLGGIAFEDHSNIVMKWLY